MSEVKEDQQQQYQDLEQLRRKVHLSSNKLLELTYNDNKFMEKLISYNLESKKLINEDLTQEALIFLAEAERILQYGASCGKSIDRNIIITTLHNQACCYYKDGDLTAAAKYLEGLIFNLKSHLDSMQSSPSSSGVDRRSNHIDPFISLTIEKKIELAQYYLKFCTINSQAKRREAALDAGRQVTQLCSTLFTDLQLDHAKITACDQNNKQSQLHDLRILISSIRVFREEIKTGELNSYVMSARYWIKKWNSSKVVKKISFCLEKHVSNYSISQVIDMVPVEYRADDDKYYDTFLNTRNIVRQILHFSMGYFTISTEYRLMAEQLYKDLEQRVKSQEFIKANIYHLLSILFLTYNLSCDLLFMKQVISSYEHHFKTDLSSPQHDAEIEQLSESLLFEPRKAKEKLNSTTLNEKPAKKKRLISEYEDSYTYEKKISMKMNASNMQQKLKRSLSKKNGLCSSKKLTNKIINESLMESSKASNNKSVSKNTAKMRSISKDSSNCNRIKQKQELRNQEKGVERSKKTTDEYQLGQAKVGKKRINSQSSADLSISAHKKTISKSKEQIQKSKKSKNQCQQLKKKELEKKGRRKTNKKEQEKIINNRHYYL